MCPLSVELFEFSPGDVEGKDYKLTGVQKHFVPDGKKVSFSPPSGPQTTVELIARPLVERKKILTLMGTLGQARLFPDIAALDEVNRLRVGGWLPAVEGIYRKYFLRAQWEEKPNRWLDETNGQFGLQNPFVDGSYPWVGLFLTNEGPEHEVYFYPNKISRETVGTAFHYNGEIIVGVVRNYIEGKNLSTLTITGFGFDEKKTMETVQNPPLIGLRIDSTRFNGSVAFVDPPNVPEYNQLPDHVLTLPPLA
jgi:hypothetical protein